VLTDLNSTLSEGKTKPSIINIGLVGGGTYCQEFLRKSALDYGVSEVNAMFRAVADTDPESPGMVLAGELGLITLNDYHELYDPKYDIHSIILLTPEQGILEDILETKPHHIRVLSYHVFEVFWKAIRLEENKLRLRNEEMETILNGIQDFILVISPDKKIIDVNEPFLKQMHYSRESVIGQYCHEVFQRVTRKSSNCHIDCPLSEVIRHKRPSQRILTRRGPKGENKYSELTIFPIWEKNGKVSKFIEISRDITKRKKEEEEMTRRLEMMVEERTQQLKETHEKLLHQDKIASLGKLSASVVHEINNPIAGILNMIMLIKRIIDEGNLEPAEIDLFKEYLDLMETETRRTSRIVSNLLAFSRQSKMELKKVNINQLIEQTLFLNMNLLKINHVRVEKDFDRDLPELLASSDHLQQVFMNLVSNSAESMESVPGGMLKITTRYRPKQRKIVISLEDTGEGIPPEQLSKLFEPFYTTKKKGQGVGLGLSVAYGIVQEHGGAINVRSMAGQGATFFVELPIADSSESFKHWGESHGKC
jgi:PAS domain S-box-containing protein